MFERRIKFKNRKPREFFDKILAQMHCPNLKVLSLKLKISYSVLKKYCGGYLLLPEPLFLDLCNLAKINSETFSYQIINGNLGQIKGGNRGMEILVKKYNEKIPVWREKAIKNSLLKRAKKISIPKLSEELAEFIGIHLGDGTMTKYYIRISGDYRYDISYRWSGKTLTPLKV